MTKALINRILPLSFIDGPSSRMAIFLQGCNLKCQYCHNPETQQLCISCGICVAACQYAALSMENGKIQHHPKLCKHCDRCLEACPHFSSPKCQKVSVEEVFAQIQKAAPFLDGVTISGGECTLQPDFIFELFSLIKSSTQLTTFLDTNGLMPLTTLKKLCQVTDGFLWDWKAYEDTVHNALTGQSNRRILENMLYASEKGLLYEIRTVLAEGVTDDLEDIRKMALFIKKFNPYTRWKLIPFRPLGIKTSWAALPPFPQERYQLCWEAAHEILDYRMVEDLSTY